MGDRVPAGDDDQVRNEAADIGGPIVQAGSIHGGVTVHHAQSLRWYRDPTVLAPAVLTAIAVVVALVPYLFPHPPPDGTGAYVDPERCLTLNWPGPATAVTPQHVRTKDGVAANAILRQKPCWRAQTPSTAEFTPKTGISVLCSVTADNVFDTAGRSRYDWYLVSDPTQPGKTLGWTPTWPYTAPAHDIPVCSSQSTPSWVTVVAATLACLTAAILLVMIRRRRRRNAAHRRAETSTA